MSTNELSELIAMGCPDLVANSNGGSTVSHIVDEKRRLSVKQMTATELAAARAAAAKEIKNVLAKAKEVGLVLSAPASSASLKQSESVTSFHSEPTAAPSSLTGSEASFGSGEQALLQEESNSPKAQQHNFNLTLDTPPLSSNSGSPREHAYEDGEEAEEEDVDDDDHLTVKHRLLPSSPAPRDRITSLPSILDDGMEDHFLALSSSSAPKSPTSTSLKPQDNISQDVSSTEHSSENIDAPYFKIPTSNSEISLSKINPDSLKSKRPSIIDSIELLRKQRRDHEDERERRSDSLVDDVRFVRHDRSAAPSRLNSASRRNSNASVISDVSVSATVTVPSTPSTPPLTPFPLAKTFSAPNMERRRSSLSTLFPGPSPLVAPEPVLHTDPKVREEMTKEEIKEIVEDTIRREIPTGKQVHRTKTPPPVGVSLGVNLKKVTPPRTQITVKKNEGPMLGVVLRRVERKTEPQKSILDDDKPLYHLSIVRSDGKEHKTSTSANPAAKPKPKPVPLQKSATIAAKPNPGGILTGPQGSRQAAHPPVAQVPAKPQRPMPGVPITIQKIEGDKIIIIKKIIVPKNSKIPEQYLKVGSNVVHVFRLPDIYGYGVS